MIKYSIVFVISFCILNFIGCATAPISTTALPGNLPGVYHRVEKGQTLWGIAKMYNIELDDLIKANRITDASSLDLGQLVFIPRQKGVTPAVNSSLREDFMWPVRGRVIAGFGQDFNNMINKGINIAIDGPIDVVASRSGKVIFYSEKLKGFGKTLIIDHGDGFSTVYARNSEVLIKVGDNVQQKELIAKVNTTGGRNKNTYFHFEIRKGYLPQNPYFYLPR